MEGFKPNQAAVSNFRNFLVQHLHKRKGIYIIQKEINAASNNILSWTETQQIIDANRTVFANGSQIAIYILYTNGEASNSQILGQVFGNSSIVLFGKSIRAGSNEFSFPSQTTIETSLLLHEMGHVLGLADNGSPMQIPHADSLHESNCMNQNCIMYWVTSLKNRKYGPLNRIPTPHFDSACLMDLKANGGR